MKRERKDPEVFVDGILDIDKIPKDVWKIFLSAAEKIVTEVEEKKTKNIDKKINKNIDN